tara:strand:+ start:8580 stop:8930 length:351 start_codon:yes stop_codon:yes gene_type:complete
MKKIICQWEKVDKVLINPDGQVFPCCYLSNPAYTAKIQEAKDGKVSYGWDVVNDPTPTAETNVIRKYYEHEKDLNVFNKSLSDVLAHKWFQEILPKSWEDEKTCHKICKMMCEREV